MTKQRNCAEKVKFIVRSIFVWQLSIIITNASENKQSIKFIKSAIMVPVNVYGYPASYAIDGKISTSSLLTTNGQLARFWYVIPLDAVYEIDSVRIVSNDRCCYPREVLIYARYFLKENKDMSLCTSISVSMGDVTYTCRQNVTGSEIVLIQRKYLKLGIKINEIEAFGKKIGPAVRTTNFVIEKPLKSSPFEHNPLSVVSKLPPVISSLKGGRLTQWLILDLQKVFPVGIIKISKTYKQCCPKVDFSILISSDNPESMEGFPNVTHQGVEVCKHIPFGSPESLDVYYLTETFACSKTIYGRYMMFLWKSADSTTLLPRLYFNSDIFSMWLESINHLGVASGKRNIALRKPTSQSTSATLRFASYAVDNIPNTQIHPNTHYCSATLINANPWSWWMVDLQGAYVIEGIRIYTQLLFIDNIEILVIHDDFSVTEVCKRHFPVLPHYGITFKCENPVTGRYVKIAHVNITIASRLHLCEVQVFGTKIDAAMVHRENYALRKLVEHSPMQKQQTEPFKSESAVDGVFYDNVYMYKRLHCIMLKEQTTQWVIIDLLNVFPVGTIRVTIGYKYNPNTLPPTDSYTLAVMMDNPKSQPGFPNTISSSTICKKVVDSKFNLFPETVNCVKPLVGRYVWVLLTSPSPSQSLTKLTVCEIEVFPPLITPSRQYTGTDSTNNEGGLLWRFKLIRQKGSQAMINDLQSQRHMTQCARQRIGDKTDIHDKPYFQVDLPSGECRFLSDPHDHDDSDASNWVIYQLE